MVGCSNDDYAPVLLVFSLSLSLSLDFLLLLVWFRLRYIMAILQVYIGKNWRRDYKDEKDFVG